MRWKADSVSDNKRLAADLEEFAYLNAENAEILAKHFIDNGWHHAEQLPVTAREETHPEIDWDEYDPLRIALQKHFRPNAIRFYGSSLQHSSARSLAIFFLEYQRDRLGEAKSAKLGSTEAL